MNQPRQIFARNFRFLRDQRRWSQEFCAKMIGIKRCNISAWEEGRALPEMARLPAIMDAFRFYDAKALLTTDLSENLKTKPAVLL